MINTPITEMLGIEYPVFQGGMAWVADGKLAAAVSNLGSSPPAMRQSMSFAKRSISQNP